MGHGGLTMYEKIEIPYQDKILRGSVSYPENHPKAWIIFAHGSGSSHLSPRNKEVAKKLTNEGFGTLLFDLLTPNEDSLIENRFDIALLSQRLLHATSWLLDRPFYIHDTPIGFFGASTGAAAALVASTLAPINWPIYAVVSRGGRPDLAGPGYLRKIKIPTLLIVGEKDYEVIKLNMIAQNELEHGELALINGATHLFEEPGTMDEVIKQTIVWFSKNITPSLILSSSIQVRPSLRP
jgi:putative phosphoribosyl transferase